MPKWRHRNSQYCKNCNFQEMNTETEIEECHRHAPKRDEQGIGVWPVIADMDWCGEWQPRDNEDA